MDSGSAVSKLSVGVPHRKSRLRAFCRFAVLLLVALGASRLGRADPRPADRIVRAADDRDTAVVPGNLASELRRQFDQGRVEAGRKLERMAIVFKRSAAQEADLDALLAAQQDPRSPSFHRWLTPDEFAARFGTSASDLAKVSDWLRAHGLSVHEVSRDKGELYFSGTAAQVEQAFRTELHDYLVAGELHYANASDVSIPRAFADSVLAVRHLNDFRPVPRPGHRVVSGRFTSSISGNHFIAPNDFATIYDLQPLYAAGFDGSGQKIAVVGQTELAHNGATTDIDAFRAAANLPATQLQQVLVPKTGAATVCSGDVGESDLDVEWSGAIAKNATVVFVYVGVTAGHTCTNATSSIWDSLQYAVANDLAPVITTSYGACESANGAAFASTVRGWAKQANAQGQTLVAASGDSGAADCEAQTSSSATTGLAVDMPASIPEVTGMGGTELNDPTPATDWGATNDAGGGSALGYIPEIAWNDSAASAPAGAGLAASGGGMSDLYGKPVWQTGLGVPADGKRDVPDLALSASADHDGYLTCSQGNCVNGFRNTDQTLGVVGGTSVASPSFAGIVAIIAGGTGATGLGNVNPTLYALAASDPAAFHDITSGDNIVPCNHGTPDCSAHAPFELGYSTHAGYDQVTGLGSVDANELANHWAAKVATTTTLAAASPSFGAGANASFTATVTPAGAGFGSPAGGRVQFSVDGAPSGSPVLVAPSQGAFTAMFSTTTLSAGPHTLSASYGGNLVYDASSSGPVGVAVSDFTISANPTTASATAGSSASTTVTVSTTDGFAGAITFSCAPSNASVEIGCSLAPMSVALGGGTTTQSALLTITTTAPHAASASTWIGSELLAALLVLGLPLQRRRKSVGLATALFVLASSGLSCGGGGGGGGGGSSATASARPAAPTDLVATPGEQQVALSWTDSSKVRHFDVRRSTTNGGPYAKIASPTTASFTDLGLTGGTTYFYVVDAATATGTSSPSAQVSATPSNPGTPAGHYTVTVTGTSGGTVHSVDVPLTVN
jgi:hypothetical protein